MRKYEYVDLTGKRFGRLLVIEEVKKSYNGHRFWLCICDCGTRKVIEYNHLTQNPGTISCGCLRQERRNSGFFKKHGMTRSKIYRVYTHLKDRCERKTDSAYARYGGRGIKCLWYSFEEFFRDMGDSFKEHIQKYGVKNTTLDRINTDGDYSKENCRWATYKEQANNKRNNNFVSYNGIKMTVAELAEKFNKRYEGIRLKINKGYTPQKAIETTYAPFLPKIRSS